MKKTFIALALLLLAVLPGCQSLELNLDRLPGTWDRVYPEGVQADSYETWLIKTDGKLYIHVEDAFSGSYETSYQYSVNLINNTQRLWMWRMSHLDGITHSQEFVIKKCSRKTLVLQTDALAVDSYVSPVSRAQSEWTFYRAD